MAGIQEILKQYWGYAAFRPLQENIIQAVLAKHDTLAILPTGGGKSICFQVPALAQEGLCLVISPLIALMKDQVAQLQARGIAAVAVHAGLHRREIDILLDNCVFGQVKFLYLSPERMQTDIFRERVPRMNVSLVAVDEAHCISQWGYDFRPPYLEIAAIREILPTVPIIALTATATPAVKTDILEKLKLRQPQVFQKSFARANLSYSCLPTEDKMGRLRYVLQSMAGSAIVYVSSRRLTQEIARYLNHYRVATTAYHAGLSHAERHQAQTDWIRNKTRVIVATNAFGMGIDKPDVRLVIHVEMPGSLEAYYQEAGRAGRDEKYAYATLLLGPSDTEDLRAKITQAHPPLETLRKIYQCLANYFQIAVGSGAFQSFDFNLDDFSRTYKLKPLEVHHALSKLQSEGFIQLNEAYFSPSKVMVLSDNEALYTFQVAHPEFDLLIKAILRIYGGNVFSSFVKISENTLADNLKTGQPAIVKSLTYLQQRGILLYEPQHSLPQVVFTTPRHDASSLPLNTKRYNQLRQNDLEKMEAVIRYVNTANRCRTQLLLQYFGEISDTPCRICDYCLQQKKIKREQELKAQITRQIIAQLKTNNVLPQEVSQQLSIKDPELVAQVISELLENQTIKYLPDGKLAMVL